MCDDFETAEEMPLETEVRHLLEERRSGRSSNDWGTSSDERRNSGSGDSSHLFVEDFAGNITAKPPEEVIKNDAP